MLSFEEVVAQQTQLMSSVSRALSNFKKMGQAKMTPAVTRQRIESLKKAFAKCQELDGKLAFLADAETRKTHPYFTKAQFMACEDAFHEAANYMVEVLESHTSHSAATHDVSGSFDSFRSTSHLPRISLPTFDGNFDQWESFRDKFKSMIISDPTLADVDRMHYLCSCVKGEASNALDHLAVTNKNFDIAWRLLTSRYDNQRRLITNHLLTLLNLPSLTSETSDDLRKLRDQTNRAIQALKNLQRPVEHWDDLLVLLVAQKLDKSTRKAWELKLGDSVEYPTYEELNQFLEARIRAFEAISPIKSKDKSQATSKTKPLASHTAATVQFSCPLCRTGHLLYQCPTFLKQTPSQRFDFIKKQKRCSNCFSLRHAVKDCTNPRACRTCHKRHHTLLHFDTSTAPVANVPVPATVPATPGTSEEVVSHFLSRRVAPNSQILLATARVRVYSPQGRFVTVRASCSTKDPCPSLLPNRLLNDYDSQN